MSKKPLSSIHFKSYLKRKIRIELELMFMKHYAPYRCLYIKVAKLRVRSGGGGVGGSQGRCEQRIEVFVKI